MLISQEDLEEELKSSKELKKIEKLKKDEVKLYNKEDRRSFLRDEVKEYLNTIARDYALCHHLKQALSLRSKGQRVLTVREADIAARCKLRLYEGSALDVSLINPSFTFFLTEGVVGDKNNGWELRRSYNAGLKWFKNVNSGKLKMIEGKILQARNRIDEIKSLLSAQGLNFWLDEVDGGFKDEFLRPEYMTFEQYERARKRIVGIRKVEDE